jgi:glycosyltransferase involved in cell wall biosynthesis
MKNPLFSIILVTYNNLHHTVNCLTSLLRTIPEGTEIIIIDNGSTDGTCSYLREMSERAPCIKKPIFLEQNQGWCRAVNLGLSRSTGGYLVCINNDVIFTSGWLQGLRECMDSTPTVLPDIKKVGIVGPVTNIARNQRQTVGVQYHETAVDSYARQHKIQYSRNWITSLFVSGFCLMMHRDCYEEVGEFDELCSFEGFHENDLSLRAQEKGWHSIIAGDVFVHRAQNNGFSDTFHENLTGLDNRSMFSEKWRKRNAGSKRLVAVYRVKNSADTLCQSLDATAQFADNIVILDDGSTDKTGDICKEHPAVSYYEFQDLPFDERRDRNRIIELAAQFDPDWVISIDSDEVFELDRKRAERLMQLNDPHTKALGFHWYTFWEPSHTYFRADGAFGQTNGYRMYKWEPNQCIVLGTPEGLHCGNIPQFPEGAHRFTNIRVKHLGYDSEEKRDAKHRFYRAVDKDPKEYLVGSKDYSHLISPTVMLRKFDPRHGISLCLITKNEEQRLESFLSFFEPLVNEICIVDTGSTDKTLEIAKLFTKKIELFHTEKLELDEARNRSLALASQPWILSMDPDEEIPFWDIPQLQRLTDDMEAHAFSFQVVNHQKEKSSIMTIAIRLFRNDKRIYYTHPVHETVAKSLHMLPGAVIKPSTFQIHHYGYLKDDSEIQKKLEIYFLRNKEYREANPEDPMPWYNEALHYLNEGNTRDAVFFLNKALELDPTFTAPYGQLAIVNQEHAILLWRSLINVMPEDHPGRAQAQQTLDSLLSLTPPRHYVGETRKRIMETDTFNQYRQVR